MVNWSPCLLHFRYKVTGLAIVPSLVHQLANHPKIRKTDLSSLISLGGGAAYLPWELRQKMLKLAKQVPFWAEGEAVFSLNNSTAYLRHLILWVPGYGMSECVCYCEDLLTYVVLITLLNLSFAVNTTTFCTRMFSINSPFQLSSFPHQVSLAAQNLV